MITSRAHDLGPTPLLATYYIGPRKLIAVDASNHSHGQNAICKPAFDTNIQRATVPASARSTSFRVLNAPLILGAEYRTRSSELEYP
jgi:hypothetical protein